MRCFEPIAVLLVCTLAACSSQTTDAPGTGPAAEGRAVSAADSNVPERPYQVYRGATMPRMGIFDAFKLPEELPGMGVAPLPSLEWNVTRLAAMGSLHQASKAGALYVVEDFLDRHAAVDVPDESGMFPLLYAAEGGHAHVLDSLLRAGASKEARDRLGNSAVHLAARAAQLYTLTFLQQRGFDLNARNGRNYTALHELAASGDVETSRRLLALKADYTLLSEPGQLSIPMIIAERAGQFETAQLYREFGLELGLDQAIAFGDYAYAEAIHRKYPESINQATLSGSTPMTVAVSSGNIEGMAWLLERGAKLVLDEMGDGDDYLAIAARHGQKEAIKLLLAHGADLNRPGLALNGENLLPNIVRAGAVDMVSFLIELGANVNLANPKDGCTALHAAMDTADTAMAGLLLAKGARADARNSAGDTPLHRAVRNNRIEHVRALLEHHVDINALANPPATALHLAVSEERADIAALLIERGADLSKPNEAGDTALHLAATSGQDTVIAALLGKGAPIDALNREQATPLHGASATGQLSAAQRLIESGAAIDAGDRQQQSPLYLAILNGHLALAQMLHGAGAALDQKDRQGQGCLFAAVRQGDVTLLQWLLDLELSPVESNRAGQSPLHLAVEFASLESVSLLLDRGADPNAADGQSRSPLHIAARRGNKPILNRLLIAGANPGVLDHQGRSLLHEVAEGSGPSMLPLLLAKGLDINAADANGNTPLHTAAMRGNYPCLQALVTQGAVLTLKNKRGETALATGEAFQKNVKIRDDANASGLARRNGLLRCCMTLRAAVYESLCSAVRGGDAAGIAAILDAYPDFTGRLYANLAPVHHAARSGATVSLAALRDRGANLDMPSGPPRHETPLHLAAVNGQLDTVAWLIEAGADKDATDAQGQTAAAAAEGSAKPWMAAFVKGESTLGEARAQMAANEAENAQKKPGLFNLKGGRKLSGAFRIKVPKP
ncbi:MAG: ankyrin repeat domain-containing protein [Candidatus Hydrogenedentes bacterium]|nr:ankyrin repeat domain-containing protein [Candidatus Hydrogenedentota bacterium]